MSDPKAKTRLVGGFLRISGARTRNETGYITNCFVSTVLSLFFFGATNEAPMCNSNSFDAIIPLFCALL
ncbi:hypothetical protein B6R26_12375 [Escherichia coli]|nr:hypothetical protein [Escherichia coli]EFN5104144.1 hypothetical protein [Escherichia coli]EFO2537548.1 hypothetical protein [Escherichia coli]EFO2547006.1 hypothetical protein [Escherichia coli]EFO2596304.1 hypothetical protein [Escherichia coli]